MKVKFKGQEIVLDIRFKRLPYIGFCLIRQKNEDACLAG